MVLVSTDTSGTRSATSRQLLDLWRTRDNGGLSDLRWHRTTRSNLFLARDRERDSPRRSKRCQVSDHSATSRAYQARRMRGAVRQSGSAVRRHGRQGSDLVAEQLLMAPTPNLDRADALETRLAPGRATIPVKSRHIGRRRRIVVAAAEYDALAPVQRLPLRRGNSEADKTTAQSRADRQERARRVRRIC